MIAKLFHLKKFKKAIPAASIELLNNENKLVKDTTKKITTDYYSFTKQNKTKELLLEQACSLLIYYI